MNTSQVPHNNRDHAPPASAQDPADREQWWLWPVISAVGLVAVLVTNYLANSLPFNGQSTGDVTDAYLVPFQPAGWVFGTIWPTIYTLVAIYVVYSFLPAGRRHSLIDRVGPFLLIANIANISWLFAWHWERLVLALVILLVLAAALAATYLRIRTSGPEADDMSVLQRLLVTAPFSVYLGWVCIASLANVQILMSDNGWDDTLFTPDGWTVNFMVIGIAIAAVMALRWHDTVFPLVFAYAYAGIASRQWGEDTNVGFVAVLLAVVAVALAVIALVLSSRRGETGDAESPVIGAYGNNR
jgi:benzodiazapine receptor